MSPYAEAYLTGAYSLRNCRLVVIPRVREYLTPQVWERLLKALRVQNELFCTKCPLTA